MLIDKITKKGKVFIADDDQIILTQVSMLLKDDYDIKLFKSGKDLLEYLISKNDIPDLILLDVLMRDCCGYDIIKDLKSIDSVTDIPVIFLTVKNEYESEVLGLELGAVDYITKPFHPLILKARINTHLSIKHFQDILKMKNAELKKYSDQLRRYLEIIELAPVSILITDKNNKIIFVNQNYINITGYSKDEILGKNPGFIKSGKTPNNLYQDMWGNLKNKKMWEGILINRKKNDELFYEETRILPILNEFGDIEYYVAVKLDVTEKLKLQEKEIMLAKAKSLINLSAGLAHHLNNINTPLLIISEYLASELKNEPEYQNMLKIMMDSVGRATKLINSIRTFSKNNIMSMKILNFSEFINILMKSTKSILKDNIELQTKIESIEGIMIYADINMLERAIINVIENSIEAMPEGGKITINTYKTNKNNEEYIVVEVEDNGIGIPQSIKTEVFEPFFTTKAYKNAKGLGLSETLGIIEQHNGLIELESMENKGTMVKIYIPIYTKNL